MLKLGLGCCTKLILLLKSSVYLVNWIALVMDSYVLTFPLKSIVSVKTLVECISL